MENLSHQEVILSLTDLQTSSNNKYLHQREKKISNKCQMHMLLLFCTTLPVLVLFLTLQFCSRNKPHNKQYMKQFSQLLLGIFGPFLHLTVKAVVFFSKYLSAECFPNKSCNYDFLFDFSGYILHCILSLHQLKETIPLFLNVRLLDQFNLYAVQYMGGNFLYTLLSCFYLNLT